MPKSDHLSLVSCSDYYIYICPNDKSLQLDMDLLLARDKLHNLLEWGFLVTVFILESYSGLWGFPI